MRRSAILALTFTAALAACGKALPPMDQALEGQLHNPLFAQAYYSDLVDHFVSMEIHNDPVLQDKAVKAKVDAAREEALGLAQAASRIVQDASEGGFARVKEETAGTVIATGSLLYFGTDFFTVPGADLRVYVTGTVDPRDAAFPGPEDAEIGPLQSPYGAQAYTLPAGHTTSDQGQPTIVLWDVMLKRLHGFAQLR